MREQSFHDWLLKEIESCRKSLISLYENRDRILYIEAPELRKKYLSIFGDVENSVLQSELEVSLLRRKIELIQTAVNRREKVDPEKIEEQIRQERKNRLSEIEKNDATLNELPQLSAQQLHTLKRLYHDITDSFHPAVNADLTESEMQFFQNAVNAFKMQDVDAMRVIHDCLFSEHDSDDISFELETSVKRTAVSVREEYHSVASSLTTDYSLAKKLYPLFLPLEEDSIINGAISDYKAQIKDLQDEIEKIRSEFPFNAIETINDKAKTEQYFSELKMRSQKCEIEKKELQSKINMLTEGRMNG